MWFSLDCVKSSNFYLNPVLSQIEAFRSLWRGVKSWHFHLAFWESSAAMLHEQMSYFEKDFAHKSWWNCENRRYQTLEAKNIVFWISETRKIKPSSTKQTWRLILSRTRTTGASASSPSPWWGNVRILWKLSFSYN